MSLPKTLNLSDPAAVSRFIGGRRRINAMRRERAENRRFRLIYFWTRSPLLTQTDLARTLGVARSTISKDIRAMRKEGAMWGRCPCCDKPYPMQDPRPFIDQMKALSRAGRGLAKMGRY